MIGALVVSFPRKPILDLKHHHRKYLFPKSLDLIDRCHKIAVEARGSGYLDKELTIYAAVTSYFLGLVGAYIHNYQQTRLYFGEGLSIMRVLGVHKLKDPELLSLGALPTAFGGEPNTVESRPQKVDFIQQELGRRLFFCLFVGIW